MLYLCTMNYKKKNCSLTREKKLPNGAVKNLVVSVLFRTFAHIMKLSIKMNRKQLIITLLCLLMPALCMAIGWDEQKYYSLCL